MSKFSTIDSQHAALRDLERQRLERMMGQLRREVDCADGVKVQQRRFQPPRRTDNPSKPAPRAPRRGIAEPGIEEQSSSLKSSSGADRGAAPGPIPGEILSGSPSVEMAWLMQVSSQMDTEQEEVQAFLARHGLDRYATLLSEDPGGIGSSMENLRLADDAGLADVGLMPSPRRHLLEALRQSQEDDVLELQRDAASSASPIIPAGSRASTPGAAFLTAARDRSSPSMLPEVSPQGRSVSSTSSARLGRLPPGWERRPTGTTPVHNKVRYLTAPVTKVDASCGDDDGDGSGGESVSAEGFLAPRAPDILSLDAASSGQRVSVAPREDASAGADGENCLDADLLDATANVSESEPPRRSVSSMVSGTRPSSSSSVGAQSFSSRPASRAGNLESVCCYQCYKQVYPQFAVEVGETALRRFCGSTCADQFRKALSARQVERDRRLGELRNSVTECSPDGVQPEVDSMVDRSHAVEQDHSGDLSLMPQA